MSADKASQAWRSTWSKPKRGAVFASGTKILPAHKSSRGERAYARFHDTVELHAVTSDGIRLCSVEFLFAESGN